MRARLQALPYVILLLPLDLLVVLAFVIAGLIELVVRGGGIRGQTPNSATQEFGVCPRIPPPATTILIVNWDGKHLLDDCLPSVLDAVRHDGGNHEILVVDNGSTDGSVEFVRGRFPEVRVLPLDRNYGFAGGNNRGVAEVQSDIVILLNNDMVVDRAFLRPLLDGFSDPSVFAVTCQIFFPDPSRRREETGKTRARFDGGFLQLRHDQITSSDEHLQNIPVFWAGGGSCAFDRRKYQEIGGFDSLYNPFYVEDADLSYQGWKRGWKCVLAPASHVVHKHRGTSRPKFGNQFVDNTIRKNLYLFIWKNVTDFAMIFDHLANLPWIHGRAMLLDGPAFEIRAFLRAVRQLPEALQKRLANRAQYVIFDHDVFARSQPVRK